MGTRRLQPYCRYWRIDARQLGGVAWGKTFYSAAVAEQSSAETPQHANSGAQVSMRMGKAIEIDAHITTLGLLAVGAMMSGILLGSAAIVLAARQNRRPPRSLSQAQATGSAWLKGH
jgi:hypothetical protein